MALLSLKIKTHPLKLSLFLITLFPTTISDPFELWYVDLKFEFEFPPSILGLIF
jgi:hypothetical protein